MASHYQLLCRTEGPLVRVDVNDVPLVRWERTSGTTVEHLNPWLVAGPNEIRVVLAWPATDPGGGHVEVSIHQLSGEGTAFRDEVVAKLEWPPAVQGQVTAEAAARAVRLAERRARHEALMEFSPAEPPPTQLWSSVGRMDLTQEAALEIAALAASLQRAADRLDLDGVAGMLEYRTRDLARAFHVSEEEVLRELVSVLIATLPRDVLEGRRGIDPAELVVEAHENLESELQVHLVANGRLAWVTRADYAPALRTRGPPRFETSLFVARIDGAWTIVR